MVLKYINKADFYMFSCLESWLCLWRATTRTRRTTCSCCPTPRPTTSSVSCRQSQLLQLHCQRLGVKPLCKRLFLSVYPYLFFVLFAHILKFQIFLCFIIINSSNIHKYIYKETYAVLSAPKNNDRSCFFLQVLLLSASRSLALFLWFSCLSLAIFL